MGNCVLGKPKLVPARSGFTCIHRTFGVIPQIAGDRHSFRFRSLQRSSKNTVPTSFLHQGMQDWKASLFEVNSLSNIENLSKGISQNFVACSEKRIFVRQSVGLQRRLFLVCMCPACGYECMYVCDVCSVCMYLCMCVCMYMSICTCAYTSVGYVWTYVCTHTCTPRPTLIHSCM